MSDNGLVFIGTYSEKILFGTGQVLEGKGKGIDVFRFDAKTAALEPVGIKEGVRNPSYVAFDPTRRFLYCVNEFKEYEAIGEELGFAFVASGPFIRSSFNAIEFSKKVMADKLALTA